MSSEFWWYRWLGALTIWFIVAHLVTLLLDRSIGFSVGALLVPFVSEWRPEAVAFGIGAFWILVVIEVSSLTRRHLPRKLWRGVHLLSLVAFWFVSVHGALAGSDSTRHVHHA